MAVTEKNKGEEFATMDDEERKRFAGTKDAGGQPGQPRPLSFDDPRDADRLESDPHPGNTEPAEAEEE